MEQQVETIHADTIAEVQSQIDTQQLQAIKQYLNDNERLHFRHNERFKKIAAMLLRRKKIDHGKYDLLKEMFSEIPGLEKLADILSNAEESIKTEKENEELIVEIHANAMLKIKNEIDSEQFEDIKSYLLSRKSLTTRPLQKCTCFQRLSEMLLRNKRIKHGEYKLLKNVFEAHGLSILMDDLTKAEEKIASIRADNETSRIDDEDEPLSVDSPLKSKE